MAKKEQQFKNWTVQIMDNGSVTVLKDGNVCSVAKSELKAIAEANNWPIEEVWTTQELGKFVVDVLEMSQNKTIKFDGRTTVEKLKRYFKCVYNVSLRIYDDGKLADNSKKLSELRSDGAKNTGVLECRANITVGSLIKRVKEQFGLDIKIATQDDWVLVLDGITLANAGIIKKNATKDDMKGMVGYQREECSNEHNEPERGRDFIVTFGGRGGAIFYFYPCNTEELESAYDSLKEDDDSDAIREYIDKNLDNFPTYFGFFLPAVSNDEIYLNVKDENGESVYEGMHPVTWCENCVEKDEDGYFCDWKCDENMDPALKEHLLEKFEKYRNDDKSYDDDLFYIIPGAKEQSKIKGLDRGKCLVEFCLARYIYNEVHINIPQGENFNVNKLSLFFYQDEEMLGSPIIFVSPIIKYDNTLYCQDCDPEVDISSSSFGFATVFEGDGIVYEVARQKMES